MIEAGDLLEDETVGVDPHAADPIFTPHDHLAFRRANNDDNVADPFRRAEQQHLGAGKPGCDGDEVFAQVCHQRC